MPAIDFSKKIDFSKINLNKSLNLNPPSNDWSDWPEIFTTKEISNREDAALVADALIAWGLCIILKKVHPNFGEVMVLIGDKIGMLAIPENLMKWSDEFLNKTTK
jgi:hypothetical protein